MIYSQFLDLSNYARFSQNFIISASLGIWFYYLWYLSGKPVTFGSKNMFICLENKEKGSKNERLHRKANQHSAVDTYEYFIPVHILVLTVFSWFLHFDQCEVLIRAWQPEFALQGSWLKSFAIPVVVEPDDADYACQVNKCGICSLIFPNPTLCTPTLS